MPTIISPQNNIIVTLDHKFYDRITYESGITLYLDNSFHPEESAMLEANVTEAPRSIIKRVDYDGYLELPAPGDKILIRYDVVFSYRDQPDRSTPIHDNVFWVAGQEYWKVDVMQVFAIKEGAEWRMVNGYVWCDKLAEDRSIGSILILPEYMRTEIRRDRMRVRFSGPGEVKAGDIVYCSPNVAQLYRIGTQEFYIIKQSHILAAAL